MAHGYIGDKENLLSRLRKIEGQVRGIQRMIDEDRYCVDILTQIAAIKQALNKVSIALLEGHTKGCVADAIQHGHGDERIEELMKVIFRFLG
ncbi:MAG: metal-sensitive transcriptional regulator [bacterium]|jgi:DNA-binding FrmR family transcriptional regulator|nr:metal-sensitive transcriptional regulator [Bacillota bacterium]HHW55960.1 metal-sensitive transcriptional regulator [Bacillota bacterium]